MYSGLFLDILKYTAKPWECGGTVVRTPPLESQGYQFHSHWVSTLATLGKLLT